MTIYKDDIKLFESKVMTDESDGGGAMTDQEIISGEHNSIFPDISDLDRAYGVVNIRSVHLKVDADSDETYYGSTIGLSETPVDDMVEVTLMSVNDPYIEREETADLIEQYLTVGAKYGGELFYDHIKGQRTIKLMQRTSRDVPNAGDVLVVSDLENDSEQYCRLINVSSEILDFEIQVYGAFDLKIVTCEISEPLRYGFKGGTPNPYMSQLSYSRVYEVSVADASKYYGTKQLSDNGTFGSKSVQVEGIYNQLVPSARIDNAIVNQPIAELVDAIANTSADGTSTTTVPMFLESQSLLVDIENQGYVYVQTLIPTPSLGTLIVKYMTQGNWYTLTEDGTGALRGEDESHGAGTLDAFGNVTITTGALPDVKSEIIFQWGNVNANSELVGDSDFELNSKVVAQIPTVPNSADMTFTWDNGDKVAVCTDSVITGDATGYVKNNRVNFTPNILPEPGTIITSVWSENVGGVDIIEDVNTSMEVTENDTDYMFNVGTSKHPNSISIIISPSDYSDENDRSNYTYETKAITLFFNADLGRVLKWRESALDDSLAWTTQVGTYNSATGDVTISKDLLTSYFTHREWGKKLSFFGGWTVINTDRVSVKCNMVESILDFEKATVTGTTAPIESGTFDFTLDQVSIWIDHQNRELVDDNLVLNFNGDEITVSEGLAKVRGAQVGTFDRDTNLLTLTQWSEGDDSISVVSGVFKYLNKSYLQDAVFITKGNPVANRSLQINAITADGTHQLGTADENGVISGGGFSGTINHELGIVKLFNENLVEALDIKYNCVSYNYLPLDADQVGIDPIKLPSDGRVVIFEKGDVVVVYQDNNETVTVEAGDTVQLEVRLATCTTTASDAGIDLDAGTVFFPTDGTFDIEYRFEDIALLTYVDISGAVKLSKSLSHNYDYTKSKMASLLIAGDLFARYTNLFDQKSWSGVFSDKLIGSEATVAYNDTLYPIKVTNDGCITERMAIVFTSSTAFKLIGENIGQIAVGDINTDFAPINPVSGKPYFTLNKLGWGAGWSTNNVLRFDTYGAVYQLNVIRTILQGDRTNALESDQFALQIRGNINKVVI
ncbi:hypothetical protein ACR30L_07940 [Psychromonas sp. PT13]|uniref:hypothetical protein n=1 Tax=Psychromonas sp. PT13 TaxID=3439547 RepID=UPI003EBB1907